MTAAGASTGAWSLCELAVGRSEIGHTMLQVDELS